MLHFYQNGVPIQLTGLMAYISDYKATDPRDRIYSVLGLAADRSLADPPRYQDSLVKVYSSLVKSFIEHHKCLDIICLADRFHGYVGDSPILPALPSWVPDVSLFLNHKFPILCVLRDISALRKYLSIELLGKNCAASDIPVFVANADSIVVVVEN